MERSHSWSSAPVSKTGKVKTFEGSNPSLSAKIGKNIKRIREEKDMTQGDICRAVGPDRAQMSNIEAGKGNPTLATIEKIAQALGVSSDELLK